MALRSLARHRLLLRTPSRHLFALVSLLRAAGALGPDCSGVVKGSGVFSICPDDCSGAGVCRGGAWPPATDREPALRRRWSTLDKATGRMVPDTSVRVETGAFSLEADF